MYNITLGVKEEIHPTYDFTTAGWGAKNMIAQINHWVYLELVNRKIKDVTMWSTRTNNVFINNGLETVGQVIHLPLKQVANLRGCGIKTYLEIYDFFLSIGFNLAAWKVNII